MARSKLIMQVASPLWSGRSPGFSATGAVALILALALGGCATKARNPAALGNIEGGTGSAATTAPTSRPAVGGPTSTAVSTQPVGAGGDSSYNLSGERSEPGVDSDASSSAPSTNVSSQRGEAGAGNESSAPSTNVSGQRGEPGAGNESSSSSANVSGERGAGRDSSSSSANLSGERGEHGTGESSLSAQSETAGANAAGGAGAASSLPAGSDAGASSSSDAAGTAGHADGEAAVTGPAGAGQESAGAMGSSQGENGAVAGEESQRGGAGGPAGGITAAALGTAGDNASSMAGTPAGNETSTAAQAGGAEIQGSGSSAAESAGGDLAGAVGGGPANRSGIGGGVAGLEGSEGAGAQRDMRVAAVDVPNSKVNVDEEYRPQTLGGMLPMVLGVNEDGRFDFDQYVLRDEVKAVLDQLAVKLTSADYDRLDIIGYTDHIGTPEYNQRLSELRAWSVAQYLLSRGVPENKIRYEGRGEKNPLTRPEECTGLARDDLIACLQKDRRVEIEASIRRKHATVTQ